MVCNQENDQVFLLKQNKPDDLSLKMALKYLPFGLSMMEHPETLSVGFPDFLLIFEAVFFHKVLQLMSAGLAWNGLVKRNLF